MASPIVPNIEYGLIDGQVVTTWCSATAGGATTRITVDLPSYSPWIDTRIGHPVLSMMIITDETAIAGSEVFLPATEMERGTSADSTGEWDLVDYNTVGIYLTADQNGFLGITYIAFGGQRA